jgi:hypothetical protein
MTFKLIARAEVKFWPERQIKLHHCSKAQIALRGKLV